MKNVASTKAIPMIIREKRRASISGWRADALKKLWTMIPSPSAAAPAAMAMAITHILRGIK